MEDVEKMRTSFGRDVAVLPPQEVESIIGIGRLRHTRVVLSESFYSCLVFKANIAELN